MDTNFHEKLKGLCVPNCNEGFQIHRGSTLPENLHHHFSQDEISFLSSFDFKYSDLTDAELTFLCQILIKDKDVYSRYKYDVGCTKQKFQNNLTDDAFFKPQPVTKVPIPYREQVNALLERLIQVGIIREINIEDALGTILDNPIIYLHKEQKFKLCVNSRFLNSLSKLVSMRLAIEPILILLTRLTGKNFSVSDLSIAYHQVLLTEESQKCTALVIGNKQYIYCRGFYGLSDLSNFFSRLVASSMAPLIKTNQALTYIDDTILQAQNKAEMFEIIRKYHSLKRTAGLKVSPEKTFLFLQKVKFLGQIVSNKGIQPIAKRVHDLKNLKAAENERDVMKVTGSSGWYSNYIKNLRVNCKPLYELTDDNTPFNWNNEHKQVFKQIKEDISSHTILAFPDVRYPFHIHVDSSNVGTGSNLVQEVPEGKRVVSFNSRIFDKTEQKLSTMQRELCGTVSVLKTYEHYIIGSPHTIYV